jgi:DNA polymerase-3 subunit delta
VIILLHGPDELLRAERLAALRAALGPREMAELGATWYDGRKTSVAEICHTCDVMPFLTPRRLVVVEGLLTHLRRRSHAQAGKVEPASAVDQDDEPEQETAQSAASSKERKELIAYLPQIPDTTDLVFVEMEEISKGDPVVKKLLELGKQGRAEIVLCQAPLQNELASWIVQRAQHKGARIERPAAQELAAFIGRNLRLIDNELEKLAAYRAGQGPITQKDVRLLTPYAQEANIFDMVDAIGRRDGSTALRLLRELERDGAAPLYLLSMIVRQFRILIQVADQMGLGLGKEAIAAAISLHPYPTQKAMQQSSQWRMSELEAVYDRLLETDLAIKTGKLPDDLAVELLVVELSER